MAKNRLSFLEPNRLDFLDTATAVISPDEPVLSPRELFTGIPEIPLSLPTAGADPTSIGPTPGVEAKPTDVIRAIAETPADFIIGTIGLVASVLEAIKRRAIQLAGGGILDDAIVLRQFEAVTPESRPGKARLLTEKERAEPQEPETAEEAFERVNLLKTGNVRLPGAIAAEAVGVVSRIPDIAAKVLRAKQEELVNAQDTVTLADAPITKLNRLVVQSGVPSAAVAIGISLLTGNPMVGLIMLGESAGGAEFQNQLEAGGSVRKALIIGELSEAAEIGGEMLVFPKIVRGFKEGLSIRQALILIAENATQEGVTGFNQRFLEVFGLETTAGTNKLLAAKKAFVAGVIAIPENAFVGGAVAGATGGAGVAIKQLTGQVESDIQAEEPAPAPPPQPTPAPPAAAPVAERPAEPPVTPPKAIQRPTVADQRRNEVERRLRAGEEVSPRLREEFADLVAEIEKPPKAVEAKPEAFETSDLATSPNIPISQVEAKKQATGKFKLFFRGTTNEVFQDEEFNTVSEARQFFKVQKLKAQEAAQPPTEAKPTEEIVITKPSEAITEIPKAPPKPITEKPLIPLKGKEAQVFVENVRTQEKITEAEAGEVGIEPAGVSFTDHIETFQSYQLPKTSRIPAMTKQMKRINGLRLSGKITAQVANKRIHKLRSLLIRQAIKEKIALRVDKKGKVKIALRESGVFVPKEVAAYTKFKNIEPMLGGGQDITRAIQQMDGSLTIKEKLVTKGQAGPIERFVLWRTRKMTLQKLNWLKEKTIEIRGILSAKKGSASDKNVNRILEQIGKADRDVSIESILGKEPSASKSDIKAAVELRQFYDDLIEEQNAARLMRGQEGIPYRQNYSPQIIRDVTVWEQLFLRDKGVGILESKDLPDYIKPNAPFNPRAQAREADVPYDKRVLSARELAESYIITASKDIFNTSIIQNNKAFIDQLKGQGLEKTAEYLAEWTATSYAGIKPRLDRAIKLPKWAQGGLRYFNRLRNLAVFPLNVAWSLSTQPLSLSNTIGRYGLPNTVRGFVQWLQPSIRKQAAQDYFSFIVKSSRRGGVTKQDASNLLGDNIKTQKTTGEFIENFTTIFLTEMEKLLTGTSIRAAHITGAKRGLKGEALKQFASDGGGKTQSMYNDEDKPMILRSLLVKSGAPYQTYAFEVANTFREWAGRTGTPPDSKLYAMWSMTRWLAALTVLKMMANFVRGKEWSWWDLLPIPFREFWLTPIASKLTGEFVPGSSGLPSPVETGARIAKGINDVLETGNWRKLRNETVKYGPGVFGVPGGVQWSRIVDAMIIYASGELTDRRGRVMFEMKDPEDLARAMFSGVWTTKEARKVLERRRGKEEPKKKRGGF